MRQAGRASFVAPPQHGYVVVYDREVDELRTDAAILVGTLLSKEFGVPVLCVLNYDDDILCYWLFEQGQLIDEFNSRPDYFEQRPEEFQPQGGDLGRLCSSLVAPTGPAEVENVLRKKHYVLVVDQHMELANALGLPPCSVGLGYDYVTD